MSFCTWNEFRPRVLAGIQKWISLLAIAPIDCAWPTLTASQRARFLLMNPDSVHCQRPFQIIRRLGHQEV